MTSEYFYSPSTGGFYSSSAKKEFVDSVRGWPVDAIALSDEEYTDLLNGQDKGLVILPDEDGFPFLSEPDIDWLKSSQTKKESYLSQAAVATSDWRTELQLDIISNEDTEKLSEWMAYIKKIKEIDTATVNDKESFNKINWPTAPSQ